MQAAYWNSRYLWKPIKLKTIFTESNASSKVAETLIKSTGVRLKTLNPLKADPQNDKNYLNLDENMSILAKELKWEVNA